VAEQRSRTFYRVATAFPPPELDYRTARDKRGDPPADAKPELVLSWDGLSAFDTEAAARAQGQRLPRLGHLIVRYLIPERVGIIWRQTTKNRHHYDLFGPGASWPPLPERKAQLEAFLDPDYLATV
jgi:hypothetical protein